MKDILTGRLRRSKEVVFSMMNSAVDVKRLCPDNIVSIRQSMVTFLRLLQEKHEIDHAEIVRLYSFNQGELDEL